ncbi:MAG: 2,3-bisphosphoglycerate-independent phosphoglycerate mutase [Acidobacteriota bacterium]
MENEELLRELSIKNDKKIVLLIIDGVGGIPLNGATELESAHKPNLDKLAEMSSCGTIIPVEIGITPGSGPAHLAIFGYDPLKYHIGRGILEALGIGILVEKNDLAVRGNFATINEKGIIVDRRAGRISTEKNIEICKYLSDRIRQIDDVKVEIFPGKEHRFVVLLKGDNLRDELSDADPQKDGLPLKYASALVKEAKNTEIVVNKFINMANENLEKYFPANSVLLRGFSKHPDIPSMGELFKLNPAAIAQYPMYRGLAQIVGMKILDVGAEIGEIFECLENNWKNYDFFYIHIKKTDSFGEDGDFKEKVKMIEKLDKFIPEILKLNPDVFAVTSDHSTPSSMKAHSWHPNPFLLYSPYEIRDEIKRFTERECAKGILGRFYSKDVMRLLLANALKLKKFGA